MDFSECVFVNVIVSAPAEKEAKACALWPSGQVKPLCTEIRLDE